MPFGLSVVVYHQLNRVRIADKNQLFLRPCYRGVEEVAVIQSARSRENGYDYAVKLVSLAFVYGDGVSKLQLRRVFVAELNPVARLAVIAFPANIVIILGLHDLVADAEGLSSDNRLVLAVRLRVESLLKPEIQFGCSELALL